MAFPAGLPLITVECQFDTLPDGGADGFARFIFAGPLTGAADNSVVPFIDEVRTLNSAGHCTLQLPPCNHPNWSPTFTYIVLAGVGDTLHEGRLTLDYQLASPVQLSDHIQWTTATVTPGVTYATLGQLNSAIAQVNADIADLAAEIGDQVTEAELAAGLATKANTVHTHTAAQITDLGTVLADYATDLELATGLATKASTVHTHTAAQITDLGTVLAAYAPLASPTFTGTVAGITAAMVGLGNVNNTSDATKPVSVATQAALDLKANLVGGVVPTAELPAIAITDYLGTSANEAAMLAKVGQKGDWTIRTDTGITWVITGNDPTQLSSWTALSYPGAPVTSVNGQTGIVVLGQADVGLGSVNNTSDLDKPVSTATQNALNLKANLASPTFTGTVAGITAAMVGLGNVNNTSDADKPVSNATQTALDGKLDEVNGEVVDSTLTIRKGDNSSKLRFRATGGAVDVDKIAGDVVVSSFANPDFTGTQTPLLRLRDNGITAAGLTEFGSTVYTGEQAIDAATGVARLGAKNSLTNLSIAGYKSTFGAPLSGTWATGDVVLATDGIWRCMTGGTPGVWRAVSGPDINRIVDAGEVAVDRPRPTGQLGITDRQAVLTHFTAQVTETIQFFTTRTGDTPTLAVGSTHAWVAIYKTDGANYTPDAVSVDDPTRWTSPFATYDTQLFDAAHPGESGFEGWDKVAGQRYASFILWRGSGAGPQLFGGLVTADEMYQEPRLNGYLDAQDFPPTAAFSAAFVQADYRLIQALFKR